MDAASMSTDTEPSLAFMDARACMARARFTAPTAGPDQVSVTHFTRRNRPLPKPRRIRPKQSSSSRRDFTCIHARARGDGEKGAKARTGGMRDGSGDGVVIGAGWSGASTVVSGW